MLNEEPIPPRADGDAHLGTKDVYSADGPRSDGWLYPNGSIIVKEAARPDTGFIGLVAIMRKARGANPAHNNWVWDEYTRSSPDELFTLTASDEVCWQCHMGAAEADYVWIATLGLTR
jgi:Cytochrome P460